MRILLPICLLITIACNKSNDFIASGRIMRMTDSTPYSNTTFVIVQSERKGLLRPYEEHRINFKTDDNGYFNELFDSKARSFGIMSTDPGIVVKHETMGKSKHDFGVIYYNNQ